MLAKNKSNSGFVAHVAVKDALDSHRRIFPAPLFRTAVMPGDRLPDVGMERLADGTGFGRALQDFLVLVAVIARQVEIEPDGR